MIDFRYHLVSIASVFLALAVGIVLGAGPLKGTIGDTLAGEVAQLREDSNTLRSELSDAQQEIATRDEVITALRTTSVEGSLTGRGVSILALPGSDDATVEAALSAVVDSGGRLGAQVRLDPSWTSEEPPDANDRSAAAAELREIYSGDLPVGIPPDRVLALTLGWALATDPTVPDPVPEGGGSGDTGSAGDSGDDTGSDGTGADGTGADGTGAEPEPTDPAGSEPTENEPTENEPTEDPAGDGARVLSILADYGLIAVDSEDAPAWTDAVIVVGPDSADSGPETVAQWRDVVAAIDEAGAVVVAGAVPEGAETEANLVLLIRDGGDLAAQVSTLDNLRTPVGDIALPFALREQLVGAAGHYGFDQSASQVFPTLADGGEQ